MKLELNKIQLKQAKKNLVSLFSGCGGMDIGFQHLSQKNKNKKHGITEEYRQIELNLKNMIDKNET